MIFELLRRLWTAIKSAMMPILLALLALTTTGFAVQTVRIDGIHIWIVQIDGLKDKLATAESAMAQVKAAQAKAAEAQAAVNHAPAVISAQIAETSNADAEDYYARGRAAGLAYAAAHRVREACVASSGVGSDLSGADHPAPVDDRSGAASQLVAVTAADFGICTDNSSRLAKVRQDAQSLIDAGVAIKSDEQASTP